MITRRRTDATPPTPLWRPLSGAIGLDTNSLLPVGLIGALSVLIMPDLGAPEALGGVVVGVFFLAGAVFILLAAPLIDRWGWRRAAAAGQSATCVALLMCVVLPGSWGWLLLGLALAGVGSSISQPATTVMLSTDVAPVRRGFATSAKFAAVPAALLLSGLAVRPLGEALGWRETFLIAAALPFAAILMVVWFRPAGNAAPARVALSGIHRVGGGLRLTGLGMLLGSMLPGVVLAFLVPALVGVGFTPGIAGLIFAGCNVLAIVARALVAVAANTRLLRGYPSISWMVGLGGIGSLLIAFPTVPTVIAGAALAFTMGWGWTGHLFFLAIRSFPDRPGSTASVIQSAGMFGSAIGPILGAGAVFLWGGPAAWIVAGVASIAGAGLLMFLPRPRPAVEIPIAQDGKDPS